MKRSQSQRGPRRTMGKSFVKMNLIFQKAYAIAAPDDSRTVPSI